MFLLVGITAFPASARTAGLGSTPETSRPGPYTVREQTYDLGDTAFQPTGFPGKVELRGIVHAPRYARGGKLPMVVFLHGRHDICGTPDGKVDTQWPCRAPFTSIPSYRGYDEVGELLASYGYVVVSISANGISAADNNDAGFGQLARAELIQKHLDLWHEWTSTGNGPFGADFRNAIDFQRIGLMGHSRGGEGIVSQLKVNAAAGSPYRTRALLGIAPTDFLRQVPTGIPMGVMFGICDSDQFDLQGAHYYDDASTAEQRDSAPKYQVAIAGANHYFFNSVWSPAGRNPGSMDDWDRVLKDGGKGGVCAPENGARLSETQQRTVASAYITSFFRLQLGGERQFAGLWEGRNTVPSSASFAKVATSYHAPDRPSERLDVNGLRSSDDLTRNELGGKVELTGFTATGLCGGAAQAKNCLSGDYTPYARKLQPHGYTKPGDTESPGMNLVQLRWDHPGASLRNEIPKRTRPVGSYRNLAFRAAVDFSDARNAGATEIPIRVVVTDGSGRQASVSTTDYGQGLEVPDLLANVSAPNPSGVLGVRRLLLSQVRIPTGAFRSVDLGDVRSVALVFDGTQQGAVVVSDLAFTD